MEYQSPPDYKTVFSTMPGVSALVLPNSPEFTVVASTDEFAAFRGAFKEDLIGSSIFRCFSDNPEAPNVSDDLRASLGLCIATRKKNELAVQRCDISNIDGTFREMYWRVIHTPVLDDEGEISFIIHTAVDVSGRVFADQKEEQIRALETTHNLYKQSILSGIIPDATDSVKSQIALEQRAQRLKSFIESAPFPIGVYTGREIRIEMVNQAILDAWGKDVAVLGRRYSEVLPELTGTGIYEQLDAVYNTGTPYHAYNRRVDLTVGGKLQPFYFNYSFTPLFDASGNVYGVMNTAADVTDLAVAKQKVEQSERNFRNIILQAPIAMCLMVGPSHVVEIANKSIITLWGKYEEDIINKPIFEGVPDAREQGLEPLIAGVYNTGETFIANEMPIDLLRYGRPETLYLNFVYEAYRDSDGEILGVLAIATDVTEQVLARQKIEEVVKERTKELEMANNSLQQSNSELEQFAYIASHDLQEPLRKISMFTERLESSLGQINDNAKGHMDRITNAVSRMTNLVSDILGYSQLSGKNEVFVATDLEEVLGEAIADFDLIIEEKNAEINCTGLCTIDAIPLQMVQLFNNVISNALKYTHPDAAPQINISGTSLTAEETEILGLPKKHAGYCKLVFKDNGIGFEQEYADKIFNIFQRLHGKTQYEGTGIGLAMCKKITENHHGIIYANSREGEGSEFIVVLPVKQQ